MIKLPLQHQQQQFSSSFSHRTDSTFSPNNATTKTCSSPSTTTSKMMNKVRVVSRVRPLLSDEFEKSNFKTCRVASSSNSSTTTSSMVNDTPKSPPHNLVFMKDPRNPGDEIKFEFDSSYDEEATQNEIFQHEILPILPSLFEGINTTVFCYGMTGSGKTFTMQGGETVENMGIIPRVVQQLLFQVSNRHYNESECKLSMSYLEIYNEKVHDLLVVPSSSKISSSPSSSSSSTTTTTITPSSLVDNTSSSSPAFKDLPLHEDKNKNIIVKGLGSKTISTYDEFCEWFYQVGMKNRKVASTKLNDRSSRSHAILTLTVKKKDEKTGQWFTGKINLIDLAGSEDNRKTGNTGTRLTESSSINTSLFSLRKVVDQLNSGTQKVSYRDSKLTRLLQDSLGGNSQAIMIINISPYTEHYMDTFKSLRFGMKSQSIVNKPTIHTSYFENEEERAKLENMANIGYGADRETQLKLLQLEKEKHLMQRKIGVHTSKSLSYSDLIQVATNFATKEDLERAQADLRQGLLDPMLIKKSISLQDEILDRLAKLEHFALTQQGSSVALPNLQSIQTELGHNSPQMQSSPLAQLDDILDMKKRLYSILSEIDSKSSSPPPLNTQSSSPFSNNTPTWSSTSSTTPSSSKLENNTLSHDKLSYSTPRSAQSSATPSSRRSNTLPTPPLFSKTKTTKTTLIGSTSTTPLHSSPNKPFFQPPKIRAQKSFEKPNLIGKVTTPLKSSVTSTTSTTSTPTTALKEVSSLKKSQVSTTTTPAGTLARTPLANITNHTTTTTTTNGAMMRLTTTPSPSASTCTIGKATTSKVTPRKVFADTPKQNQAIVLEKASSLEHLKLKHKPSKKPLSSLTTPTTMKSSSTATTPPLSVNHHQKQVASASSNKPNSLDFNMTVGSISPIKNRDHVLKDMTLLFPENHNIQQILSSLDHVTTDDLFPKSSTEIKTCETGSCEGIKQPTDENSNLKESNCKNQQVQIPTNTQVELVLSTKNPSIKRKRFDSDDESKECTASLEKAYTDDDNRKNKVLINEDNMAIPTGKASSTRALKTTRKKVTIKESDEEEQDNTSSDTEEKHNTFKPKLTRRREKKSNRVCKIYDNVLLLEKSEFAFVSPPMEGSGVATDKSRDNKFSLAREYIKQANTLKKEGNLENALELFEKALQLIPSNEKLKQKIAKLENALKNSMVLTGEEEEFQFNDDKDDVEMVDSMSQQQESSNDTDKLSRSDTTTNEKSTQDKLLDYLNDTNNGMKQLKKLATIGDKKAEKIMECRPFKTISELSRIGFGEKGITTFIEKNEKFISELDE
ncbi:hypothetical protein C9374_014260 [Naegleria lovaniensis]|uniref:Kinesin motor domain-containing protein n=1 Tax=Naegleria lovaniensis TaxID=51637 RepID=A0AA88KAK5_NAELO|nr:uncharacterized protein C9374_014260 [Naegleria lovaniensis]KAG2370766.1 hypothetical protein C9374_014260 [Naegleria lovaniensis]